jgi:hypothetical protein
MFDQAEFKRRYLLRLMASPLVIGPLVVGASAVTVAWAFGLRMGVALFAGLACGLVAAGAFFTRLLLGNPKTSQAVVADMQRDAQLARERRLDDLDARLQEDGDPRNETLLRDLRAMVKAFGAAPGPSAEGSGIFQSTLEIAAGVEELFNQSVQSLERTLELWRTAKSLGTDKARKPVLEQREHILRDVAESVEQLGKVLAGMQSLRADERGGSELAHIRQDLDNRLAVARKVEERMRQLDEQIEPTPRDAERPGLKIVD